MQTTIMIKKAPTILLFLLTFGLTNLYAGWYNCYNFKGTIDRYPITLSFQITNGYFGEPDKKNLNINGIYLYDRYNEPIKLEGKINPANNKVILYEIQNKKRIATFEFDLTENTAVGTWTNSVTNKTMPLHLDLSSKLNDTSQESNFENIEILQSSFLKDFYFLGLYSKKSGEDRAQMDKLKILNKKNNAVFQILDFSKIETQTGNVSTIIYDNVAVVNGNTKALHIYNNIGRMGGYLTVTYNEKKNKFIVNPEPTIEGPD